MLLLVSILLYFAGALALVAPFGNRRAIATIALAPYALHLGAAVATRLGDPQSFAIRWVPSLDLEVQIATGELNSLLSMVVGGAGLLIAGYSLSYFTDPARLRKFLALMALFTGGMAGIVAAGDLFGLFVFWEVTTVASYLLIGFDDERAGARASALQAILVTTAGGLAMLGGFVLLAGEAGSAVISVINADPPSSTTVSIALALIFAGAFTKSAQFPFHFWLPGAMAAPTPASAFLHSATMVKAGVVLLLFLAPGFGDQLLWSVLVSGVGLVTMVVGAVAALRQDDLKLLLAYGTVSQLGLMVALIGLDLTGAALAVLVGHALFKSSLFLLVGVVEKAAGSRDIRRLGGLGRAMPVAAGAGAVAAASMAGVPPLAGFVTKEGAFDALVGAGDWFPLAVIAVASVLTVVYSARFWFGAFGGELPDGETFERSKPGLLAAPVLLAGLTLALGVFPQPLETAVAEAAGVVKLLLWPGLNTALAVSAAVLVSGLVLHGTQEEWGRWWDANISRSTGTPVPTERAYAATLRSLNVTADRITGLLQNGSLPIYLATILAFVLVVPAVVWIAKFRGDVSLRFANNPIEPILVAATVAGAIAATRAQRRMAAALLLGVVGYAIAGIYVAFGAPDLALTQILVETLTVALFAVVLVRLPRLFGRSPRSLARSLRLAISGLVGVFVFGVAMLATSVDHDRTIADQYIELAPEAGGRNVVNVILTNFRALDTLGEITVLAAAAVGISVLVTNASRRGQDPSA